MRQIFISILMLTSLIAFGQNAQIDDLWKMYNSHDSKSIIDKAKPLLEDEPNNVDFNLIIGRSYADLGDFKNALTFLETAVTNDINNSWRKAWALNYLGTCYFMLQDYADSETSLNECIELNATKNATNNAYGQTLLFGFNEFYKTWKTVEIDNFRFHFQNMSDTDIEKYTTLRKDAYKKINSFFKSSLPKKIDFYVWQSIDDAKKILRTNLEFSKPNFCVVHTFNQQTIGYEITQVISNYTSNISKKTRFINEGTAFCFDQTHKDRLKQVRYWITTNNNQIRINDCWENGDRYAEVILYPLSGLFVKELIDNFGKKKFLEFFDNQTYDNAKLIFGDKLDKVIQELENKINS